jgi:hypothetical protein
MWSIGCCLYWIVTGWHPFHDRIVHDESLAEAVTSGEFHPGWLRRAGLKCPEVVPLIEGLLCPNPKRRLTVEQALASPFFGAPRPVPYGNVYGALQEADQAADLALGEAGGGWLTSSYLAVPGQPAADRGIGEVFQAVEEAMDEMGWEARRGGPASSSFAFPVPHGADRGIVAVLKESDEAADEVLSVPTMW